MKQTDIPGAAWYSTDRARRWWALGLAVPATLCILCLLPLLEMFTRRPSGPDYMVRTVETVTLPVPVAEQLVPELPPPAAPEEAGHAQSIFPENPAEVLPLPDRSVPLLADWSVPRPKPEWPAFAARAPDIYDPETLDTPLRVLAQAQPDYPLRARNRSLSGTVQLEYVVSEQGLVQSARVIQADPPGYFEEAALRAIRRWTFQPGLRNGRPVAVRVKQTFVFDME